MKLKIISYTFFLSVIMSCGEPIDYFYELLEKYGYHPYLHPLEYSGTGTLLSGGVRRIDLVAPPLSCFPDGQEGITRYIDQTTLPVSTETVKIDADIRAKFLKTLASASPSIRGGIRINEAKSIEFKAEDVSVEYFDSGELLKFYKNRMSPLCKEFLQGDTSFVTQAVKIGRLEFTFFKTNKGRIYIDAQNVNQYLDFAADVKWTIEENFKLVIHSPKYVAYQLAQIKKDENIISLYRTQSSGLGEWDFYKILSIDEDGIFTNHSKNFFEGEKK